MIVRTLDEILNSDRDIKLPGHNSNSRRLLLEKDGMGFTLTDTIINAGADNLVWYKNHVEACYCLEGEGEVEVLGPEPKTYQIKPGTMYAPDKHDKHKIRVRKTLRLICVFVPPLTGQEVHDADGTYSAPE
jgi:L-ectoine synthase